MTRVIEITECLKGIVLHWAHHLVGNQVLSYHKCVCANA